MSEFVSELKAAWVGSRIRKFHQSTRGIMTPEGRQALEEEFDRKLAEHDRQVAERAWDEAISEAMEQGTIQIPDNPYRKGQNDDRY